MAAFPISVLAQQFREIFNLDEQTNVTTLTYRGIPAWDSLGHMQLVAAIENAFDIMFETDQVIDMSSFDKAAEIVRSHGIELEA